MNKQPTTYAAVLMVSAAALLATAPARAEFGIGINVGNLGFGVEARQTLSPSLDLRFGIAGIAYKTEFEYDDVDYDIEQSAAVPEVKLDWRPAQGIFRLTFGLGYYNEVSDLELTPEVGGLYTIGNTTYPASSIGTLNGKVSYHVVTPYFGVGWDFMVKKTLGFTIDVGAYYRNEPDVTMTSTATGPGSVSATDLALEAQNIKDDAWAVYPVVKLGMLFRF